MVPTGLDITLTRLQRRNRVAFVGRDAAGVTLLPGDAVVLRDEGGDYYAGTVLDQAVTGPETRCVVKVGVRLPPQSLATRVS